jgi:hypothetical protein
MIVIGLSAYMGAGKDTAGQRLVDKWGFTRVAFAEPLKQEVLRTLPRTLREIARLTLGDQYGTVRYQKLSDEEVWAYVERQIRQSDREPVFRALLQEWGTELRRSEDQEYWIKQWKAAVAAVPNGRVVATDCRFLNEADAIKTLGGVLVRIHRQGKVGDSHPSETIMAEYRGFDAYLFNDGPIESLWAAVDQLAKGYCHQEAAA